MENMGLIGVLGYFIGAIFAAAILAIFLSVILTKIQGVKVSENTVFITAAVMIFVNVCVGFLLISLVGFFGQPMNALFSLLSSVMHFLAQSFVISKMIKIPYKKACVTNFALMMFMLITFLVFGFIIYYFTQI